MRFLMKSQKRSLLETTITRNLTLNKKTIWSLR